MAIRARIRLSVYTVLLGPAFLTGCEEERRSELIPVNPATQPATQPAIVLEPPTMGMRVNIDGIPYSAELPGNWEVAVDSGPRGTPFIVIRNRDPMRPPEATVVRGREKLTAIGLKSTLDNLKAEDAARENLAVDVLERDGMTIVTSVETDTSQADPRHQWKIQVYRLAGEEYDWASISFVQFTDQENDLFSPAVRRIAATLDHTPVN